ncbi:MAG: site-specific DNA-methyltransferase [bacterium]|nr:site-specific DNA-methyltransferase [bacterium]
MKNIPDNAIDMVFCDLPYNQTQNKWDSPINLEELWKQCKRIGKENCPYIMTASSPFDKILGVSNIRWYKYELIWVKNKSTGFLNAKKMPLKAHENVLVFYKKPPVYNPQKTLGHKPVNSYTKNTSDGSTYGDTKQGIKGGGQTDRHPTTIQKFKVINNDNSGKEPRLLSTQKPLELVQYMIRTYSNPGDLVLDNCMGSGTSAIAALEEGRKFIGMEKDEDNYEICSGRVKKWLDQNSLA